MFGSKINKKRKKIYLKNDFLIFIYYKRYKKLTIIKIN